ncbi:MAG: ferredoxin [Acidimicrobiales bacterium]
MSARADRVVSPTIVVNPIACVAHGVCAELFPERITLDEWGYPIIDPRPIPEHLVEHARRAVAACPTLALVMGQAAPRPVTPARSGTA